MNDTTSVMQVNHLRKTMTKVNARINLTTILWLPGSKYMGEDLKTIVPKLAIASVEMHAMPIFTRCSSSDRLLEIDWTLLMIKTITGGAS